MSDPLWDRLKEAFGALVDARTDRLDYGAAYAVTIKSQDPSDLSVGVVFDDSRFPPTGGIPMRMGPFTFKVAAGARAVVVFENQDPDKPRALLWETGGVLEVHVDPSIATVFNGGTAEVGRVGDNVAVSSAASLWFSTVGTFTGAGPPPDVIGTISSGSPKVKA